MITASCGINAEREVIINPTTVTNINSNIKLRITYSAIERFKFVKSMINKILKLI